MQTRARDGDVASTPDPKVPEGLSPEPLKPAVCLQFRSSQNCPDLHCNQAIMLVTDGIAFNMTDFMLRYNRDENGMAPVRIFTFLLGKEVTRVLEIMEMACLNRGEENGKSTPRQNSKWKPSSLFQM